MPVTTLQVGPSVPPLTVDMLVVFAVTVLAFVLFVTEWVSVDVTALIVMVVLILLEPWTAITPTEGISGFSNEATITVFAMLALSAGVTRSGAVQRLGARMAAFAGTDPRKQLTVTVAVAGIPSGFINNTPVVAMLIPVVSDLAHRGRSSPSKLLIPLSYASMVGGMLTLIGTSTNLIASNVSGRTIGHPFSMFEFTKLGVVVFVTGTLYLVTIGHRLIPERVKPQEGYLEEYDLAPYLTEIVVPEGSPLVGRTVAGAFHGDLDVDVLQVFRDGTSVEIPLGRVSLEADDVLTVRVTPDALPALIEGERLLPVADANASGWELGDEAQGGELVELVVPSWSSLVGETLASVSFRQRYDGTVLAIRRGGAVLHQRMNHTRLRPGDTLLVRTDEGSIDRLGRTHDVVLAHDPEHLRYREAKIPLAVGIIVGVVALAALGILDILVAALAGVVAMVLTGVLNPHEIYDAVDWDVIFLLAGLIPLGIAFEQTGAAAFIGALVATNAVSLPPIAVLWLFYVLTALLTALVSNSASVILMIPVAVEAASRVDANAFAFVLGVTFAASADFMTPIGYQTNLLVYGPGGYRFTDYVRVGAPLQIVLSIVTVLGIALFWGI